MVKIASTNLNDAELMTPNFFFFNMYSDLAIWILWG